MLTLIDILGQNRIIPIIVIDKLEHAIPCFTNHTNLLNFSHKQL